MQEKTSIAVENCSARSISKPIAQLILDAFYLEQYKSINGLRDVYYLEIFEMAMDGLTKYTKESSGLIAK